MITAPAAVLVEPSPRVRRLARLFLKGWYLMAKKKSVIVSAKEGIIAACSEALELTKCIEVFEGFAHSIEHWQDDASRWPSENRFAGMLPDADCMFAINNLMWHYSKLRRLLAEEIRYAIGDIHEHPIVVGGQANYSYTECAVAASWVWIMEMELAARCETESADDKVSPADIAKVIGKEWVRIVRRVRVRLSPVNCKFLRIGIQKEMFLATSKRATLKTLDEVLLTPTQQSILSALDGRSLNKEKLCEEMKINDNRLYNAGGIMELQEMGLVGSDRKLGGYYRPDAPPEAAKLKLNGHQTKAKGKK